MVDRKIYALGPLLSIFALQGCGGNGMPVTSNQMPTAAVSGTQGNPTPPSSPLPPRLLFQLLGERESAEILERRGAEIEWNAAGHVSSLNLYWTDLQDEDLRQLVVFDQVETVLLPSTTTDAGLVHLQGLIQLKILFPSNGLTDAGLMHVQHLPELQELHMYGNRQITDAGLAYLRDLSQLEYLGLQHTELTGAGIVHLRDLLNLRWLSLAYTKTSDAELEYLRGMHQIRGLSLFGATITDEGVNRLQQALPDCVVMH